MRRTIAVALSLALLTLALYSPVADFDFVSLDDPDYVAQNPIVSQGITLHGIGWAFTSFGEVGNWHPLTWMSHMLDVTLFGMHAGAHHMVGALLHTGAAVVLFLSLSAATGATWPCALTAALFAVHPLHVESVAWIAERKDVLAALLGFTAIGAWVRYARRPAVGTYSLAIGVFVLGLLAKPTLVSLPIVFVILEWWPLGRWGRRPAAVESSGGERCRTFVQDRRLILVDKLPPLALAVGLGAVTWVAQQRAGALNLMDTGHRSLRYANALVSYVRYLGKTFWPVELAVSYPYPATMPSVWRIVGVLLVLAGLTAVALRVRRGYPWFLAGWTWYLATLLPMAGFVKIGGQALADRYTYIPLVGVFAAFAWSLRLWSSRTSSLLAGVFPVLAGVLPLLALLPVTAAQLSTWRNNETLFAQLAAVAPDSFRVRAETEYRRGLALAVAKRYEEAKAHLAAALRIRPRMSEARNTLGAVLLLEGRDAEAAAQLRAGLAINANDPLLHQNLATALWRLGQDAEAGLHEREANRLEALQPRH